MRKLVLCTQLSVKPIQHALGWILPPAIFWSAWISHTYTVLFILWLLSNQQGWDGGSWVGNDLSIHLVTAHRYSLGAILGLANWTWTKGAAFLGPASALSPIPLPRPSLTRTLSGWRWHGESPGHRGLPGPFFETALQAPRPSKHL